MLLINRGTNPYSHNGFILPKGVKMEVPEKIAKELLKIQGVEKFINEQDIKKAQKQAEAKAKEEKEALEKELDKVQKELAKLKEENDKLKAEATEKKQAENKAK